MKPLLFWSSRLLAVLIAALMLAVVAPNLYPPFAFWPTLVYAALFSLPVALVFVGRGKWVVSKWVGWIVLLTFAFIAFLK